MPGFECVICQDATQLTLGCLDGCSHAFCYTCIENWLRNASNCPSCKQGVTKLYRYKLASPLEVKEGASVDEIKQAIVSQGPPEEVLRIEERRLRSDHYDDAPPEEDEDPRLALVLCDSCGVDENDHLLLLCDGCDLGFHTYCVGLDAVPEGEWFCPHCASNSTAARVPSTARRGARRVRGAAQRRRGGSPRTAAALRRSMETFVASDSDSDGDASDELFEAAEPRRTGAAGGQPRAERQQGGAERNVALLRSSWAAVRAGQAEFPEAVAPGRRPSRAAGAPPDEEDPVARAFRLADIVANRRAQAGVRGRGRGPQALRRPPPAQRAGSSGVVDDVINAIVRFARPGRGHAQASQPRLSTAPTRSRTPAANAARQHGDAQSSSAMAPHAAAPAAHAAHGRPIDLPAARQPRRPAACVAPALGAPASSSGRVRGAFAALASAHLPTSRVSIGAAQRPASAGAVCAQDSRADHNRPAGRAALDQRAALAGVRTLSGAGCQVDGHMRPHPAVSGPRPSGAYLATQSTEAPEPKRARLEQHDAAGPGPASIAGNLQDASDCTAAFTSDAVEGTTPTAALKSNSYFAARLVDKCLRHYSSWQQHDPGKMAQFIEQGARDLAQKLRCDMADDGEAADVAKAVLKGPYQAGLLNKERWAKAHQYLVKEIADFIKLKARPH